MAATDDYVHRDENDVLRVAGSRVMLDSVVLAFLQGHSPETIQQQYPSLSLERIYGALTFYLSNTAEVDAYLERQGEVWTRWADRAGAAKSPVVERLRALRSTQSSAS